MGKKKNKGGGKPVAMSLAEFEKDQSSKPSTGPDLGSILEGPTQKIQPKKKIESMGMMSSLPEDDGFPQYKQKDIFGLEQAPKGTQSKVKEPSKQTPVIKTQQINEQKQNDDNLKKLEKTQKVASKITPKVEETPVVQEDDGFQIEESRTQKKEKKLKEKEQQIYNQPLASKGRGRGRGRVMTFIPQSKPQQQAQKQRTGGKLSQQEMIMNYQMIQQANLGQTGPGGMPLPQQKMPMPMPQPMSMPMPQPMGMPIPQAQSMNANSYQNFVPTQNPQANNEGGVDFMAPNPFATGMYNMQNMPQKMPPQMNQPQQMAQPQPQIIPKPAPQEKAEAPVDFASMMNSFESSALTKKEQKEENARQKLLQKQRDEEEYYNEEQDDYYEEDENGVRIAANNMMNTLHEDPNQFANMLNQLTLNQGVQQQFGQQNLGLISNLAQQIQSEMNSQQQDTGTETIYTADGNVIEIELGDQNNLPDGMDDDDDIIDYFLDNNTEWNICEWFLQGNCRYGDSCQYAHPKSMEPKGFENGMGGYIKGQGPGKNIDKNGKSLIEGDQECVICLEPVLANGKRFGILENCAHPFCLDCIRDWRATYDKKIKKTHYRTCPICRSVSYLVIPSVKMIYAGDSKDQLIDEYTEALSEYPCKHFNQGKGYCPFQNSCYYAHYLENGEWYDYPFKETYIDEDGVLHEVEESQQETLADRIGLI